MNFSILALLLNPSLWEQVIKVANEVTTLINHPSVTGIAQAVSDTAGAVETVAPTGGAIASVATAVEGAGSAVAQTYSTGQPSNVIDSVVSGVVNGLSSLANGLSKSSSSVTPVPVAPSPAP